MKEQNEMKAIEEMARDIFESRVAIDGIDIAFAAVYGADTEDSHFMRIAKHLVVNKGYRKQKSRANLFRAITKKVAVKAWNTTGCRCPNLRKERGMTNKHTDHNPS